MKSAGAIDFRGINAAALRNGREFVQGLLPGGKFSGNEYVVKNPRRDDRAPGSFKINIRTGVWKDFASGEGGADLISLVAYNDNIGQGEAARKLAHRLGIEPHNVSPKSNHDSSSEQNTIVTTVPTDAPAAPTEHTLASQRRSIPTPTLTATCSAMCVDLIHRGRGSNTFPLLCIASMASRNGAGRAGRRHARYMVWISWLNGWPPKF